MKRLLALLLALMLVFSMFACSADDGKKKSKASPEEEAKATVDNFISDVTNLEFDGIEEYFVDPENIPETFTSFNIPSLMEETMASLPAELDPWKGDFENIFTKVIDKFKVKFSYEIIDVEKVEDKDKYLVKVSFSSPDFSTDFENILGSALSEDVVTGIAFRLLSEGKITTSTTEEEMYALIMPEIMPLIENAIDALEIDTTTDELTLTVVEKDGEWLIDNEE